jgi:hypothetical protein
MLREFYVLKMDCAKITDFGVLQEGVPSKFPLPFSEHLKEISYILRNKLVEFCHFTVSPMTMDDGQVPQTQ